MQIRRATTLDIEKLLKLYHILSENYQDNPAIITFAIYHPTTEVYVIETDNGVVGTATVSFRAVPSYGMVAYIDDVVVDTSIVGMGYGRLLCEHCIQVARERAGRVELTSHPSRSEANKLYHRLGFVLRDTNSYVLRF
jgi:GNAT superfamily N-acetyltransferase